jgi:hypothetical protein
MAARSAAALCGRLQRKRAAFPVELACFAPACRTVNVMTAHHRTAIVTPIGLPVAAIGSAGPFVFGD